MTPQQAKQLLLTFRPWSSNDHEPEMAAALALSRQNAELGLWFENYCAVQSALHERFNQLPLPEGLKEQILSEYPRATLRPWWHQRALQTAAAGVAMLLALGSLWLTMPPTSEQDVSFAAYRSRMTRTAVRAYAMALETNDATQIRNYLAQRQAHPDYGLPKNLSPTAIVGCDVLSWQGKPVTMVCFRTGKPLAPGAKSDLFLFVIDQKDLPDPPLQKAPAFANVSSLATASWSESGKVYVLATAEAADLANQF